MFLILPEVALEDDFHHLLYCIGEDNDGNKNNEGSEDEDDDVASILNLKSNALFAVIRYEMNLEIVINVQLSCVCVFQSLLQVHAI